MLDICLPTFLKEFLFPSISNGHESEKWAVTFFCDI
nr:MAG TPA: hypothetical protein [Caudoviricetes sp.]